MSDSGAGQGWEHPLTGHWELGSAAQDGGRKGCSHSAEANPKQAPGRKACQQHREGPGQLPAGFWNGQVFLNLTRSRSATQQEKE